MRRKEGRREEGKVKGRERGDGKGRDRGITHPSPEFTKPRVPAVALVAEPQIRHPNDHGLNPPRPFLPVGIQKRNDFLARIPHADDIELHILPRIGVYERHHRGDVLLHATMPLNAVLDGVDVHNPIRPVFLRERAPGLLCDSTGAAAVPDQLAAVCDYDAGVAGFFVVGGGRGGGGVQGVGEVEAAACGEGDLADGAVGEDTEVLDGFAEVEDQPGGGAEVGGGQDGDVRG